MSQNKQSQKKKHISPSKQLDMAINQMQTLLGEGEEDVNDNQQSEILEVNEEYQDETLNDEQNIDNYVQVLDQRYQKILKIFEKEEQFMIKQQEENEQLKKKLGDILGSARQYTVLKNQDIKELEDEYQKRLSLQNQKDRQGHYDNIEIQKLDEVIEDRENQIKSKLSQFISTKAENDSLQEPLNSFKEQFFTAEQQLMEEGERLKQLNYHYQESIMVHDQLKNQQMNLLKRRKELKNQINTFYGKSTNDQTQINKIQTQYSVALNKYSKSKKQFENIDSIREKLEIELEDKNELLNETRSFINNFEKFEKGVGPIEQELSYEQSRNVRLQAENDLLKRDLERFLYIKNKSGLDQQDNDEENSENNESQDQEIQQENSQSQNNIDRKLFTSSKKTNGHHKTTDKKNVNIISPQSVRSNKSYRSEVRNNFNTNPANQKYISPQIQTEIQRLLDLHQTQSPQEIQELQEKLTKENQIINIEIRELEEKIAARMNVLDSQYQAIEKLDYECEELNVKIEGIEEECQKVIQNYELLEYQMDMLNAKYSRMSNNINNNSNINEFGQSDQKVNYYQLDNSKLQEARQDELQLDNRNENINESFNNHVKYNPDKQQLEEQFKGQFNDDNIDEILNIKPQALNYDAYKSNNFNNNNSFNQ